MADFQTLLFSDTKLLAAAIVSAAVSASISLGSKFFEVRDKLAVEYKHEQRKKLKELTGRYYGRTLHSAVNLNNRLWNLYQNHDKGWLEAGGRFDTNCGYYLLSFVHRMLSLFSLIRQFEAEAVYLDARIAQKDDFIFMNYLETLYWAMTDVALYDGVKYDSTLQRDHFFSDRLRAYCDLCISPTGFISHDALAEKIRVDRSLDGILQFFDGLTKNESRLRWDRIVILHLILMCFINRFGYKTQYSTVNQMQEVASQLNNRQMLSNLQSWLPRLGLASDKEVKKLMYL
ncbi:MAG: hypothetical protein GJV46_08000 [Geobacter sp.]|nr:hypothetical protein [Geobacter sp.]